MGNYFPDTDYSPTQTVFLVILCFRNDDSSAADLLLAVSGRLSPLISDDSMERSARMTRFRIPRDYFKGPLEDATSRLS